MNIATLVNINNIVLLVTLIINFGLSVYIFFKNRDNPVNRAFSAFLFCVSIWTFSFLIFQMNKYPEFALILRRLTPLGSSLIAGYFLYFCLMFPKREKVLTILEKTVVIVPGFVFSLFSVFSDLMIKDVVSVDAAYPFLGKVVFGPLYKLYAVYFIAYFGYGIYNLLIKYFRAQGREKLQVFYVLFGAAISGAAGIATSLILPILGASKWFTLGPPFTLIMAGFITYAMVVYKLLNIEDFLSIGIYFLTAVAALMGTFFCAVTGALGYLPLYYITLGHIAIGIIVYSYNRRNKINISYFFLVLFTGAMIFSSAILFNARNYSTMVLGAKLIYVNTFLLMASLFYFSTFFPFERPKLSLSAKLLFPIPAVIFAVIVISTDLMVKGVAVKAWGRESVLGPMFPVFAAYCALTLVYSFWVLIAKNRLSYGLQRTQIGYIFVSFLMIGVPNFLANIIFPAFFQNYRFIEPALYFALPEAAIAAYTILKHRLMSVEIIIQKGFIYTTVSALIVALYALVVIVSETLLRGVVGYSSLIATSVSVLVIAAIFQPLVKTLQNLTDRIFFRDRYDYRRMLREVGHKTASVIKLEDLTKLIASTFIEAMKVSEISLLLWDREKATYKSAVIDYFSGQSNYKRIEIDEKSPIVEYLRITKDALVVDELEDIILQKKPFEDEDKQFYKLLLDVKEEMGRLGGSLWVPIISKNELAGIIFLGYKLSGDSFTAEDIELLNTLADQAAVSLENARLYEEVLSVKNYTQDVLDAMVSGVLTVDLKGQIVTFNPMAEKITGLFLEAVVDKNFKEVFSEKSIISQVLQNTLAGRSFKNFEASFVSGDRGLVPVSITSSLLKDSNGRKTGALLAITDLTEVKALEGKVRQADKIGALGTMAAGMAHEIKNPLSSMKVLSQLFPLKFNDEEFRKKFMEIMPKEISRIDRIVESLLGFARAASPKFVPVDLKTMIEDDIAYFNEQARNSKIKIMTEFAEIPLIDADPDQLSQVFSNLILNAIQAMPEGGELRLKTREGSKTENILRTIEIEVSDTGHGISEENLKKLFDPFFTTKYAGTGLGLTISHSIIDGHKGTIDVKSQAGKGTTFIISLPVKQELV